MSDIKTNIPLIGTPLMDSNGNISEVWWRFFLDLFNRTGGGNGNSGTVDPVYPDVSLSLSVADTGASGGLSDLALPIFPGQANTFPIFDQVFADGFQVQPLMEMTAHSGIDATPPSPDPILAFPFDWAAPGIIGSVAPNDGTFKVLRGNSLAYVIADTPTAQSIPNNSSTIVTNWVERTDLNNNFNPVTGVFTAPRLGKYTVTAMITYANAAFAAGSEATVVVHVNGVQARAGRFEIPVAGTMVFSSPPSPFPLYLNAGDTVDIRAYQNSGAAVNTSSSTNTWVTIEEKP